MRPNVGNGEGGPAIVCETVHPSSQLPPGKVLLGPCMHLTVLACGRVSVDVGNVVGLEPDVTANLLIRGGERLQPVSLCRAGQGDAGRGGAGQGGAGQGGAGQGRAGQGRAGRGLAPNRACMGPPSFHCHAPPAEGRLALSRRPRMLMALAGWGRPASQITTMHLREGPPSVLTLTTSLSRASHAMASGHRLMTKNSTGVLASLGRAARSVDPMASMLERASPEGRICWVP